MVKTRQDKQFNYLVAEICPFKIVIRFLLVSCLDPHREGTRGSRVVVKDISPSSLKIASLHPLNYHFGNPFTKV